MEKNAISKQEGMAKKRYSTPYIINMLITLFFMFGFGFIPPFGPLTPVGMRVLGIFIGVVYGFSTCEIIWPSLFAFLAFGLSGYIDMDGAISAMMGHSVVFQTIVVFISAGALTHYGFGKWFVRWSLSKPIFKGNPLFYTWLFIIFFGLTAAVIDLIPLGILLYAVWQDISDSCGYPKNSSFRYVGMGGILLGTILGYAMIPYQSWMLGLAETWASVTGKPLNFGLMAGMTVTATILILTVYVLASKRVFRVDYSIMKRFDVEKLGEESKRLRPRAKRIILAYVATVVVVVLANTLMGTAMSDFVLNDMTTTGAFCLCTAVLLVLPSGEGDGKGCIEFDAIKDSISWPVIMMCAVTLALASAVTNQATGIVPWITSVFSPVFEGHGGTFILIFTIVLSMLLTNLGSNIALGAAMIPIVAPFILKSGMDPQFAGAALIYVINVGMVLPGASAPASIFHSLEGLPNSAMRTKITLFGCACTLVVVVPLFTLFSLILG